MSTSQMPGAEGPQGQPSEEEMRAYVEQLRGADPAGIVVQAYQVLGTGAEVKLGRPDARLLIDAMSALVSAVEGEVDAQLSQQMGEGVRQLQNAQIQVETESRQQGGATEGSSGAASPAGESGGAGAPDAGRDTGAAGADGPDQQQMTDRLWIPGRGGPGP